MCIRDSIYLLGDLHQQLLDNEDLLPKKVKLSVSCPEPYVERISDNSIIIMINSAWFLDRELRFLSLEQSCEYFNEIQLIESLESIFEDYPDHQKIILAHHGIHAFSEIAGKGLGLNNLIPIYGQLYNGFRKHIGQKGDLAQVNYRPVSYTHLTLPTICSV